MSGDHLPSTLAKNTTEDHVLSTPARTPTEDHLLSTPGKITTSDHILSTQAMTFGCLGCSVQNAVTDFCSEGDTWKTLHDVYVGYLNITSGVGLSISPEYPTVPFFQLIC